MTGMSGSFSDIVQSVFKLPQTQRDISQIAETTKTVQSPEVQAVMREIQGEVTDFARVQLVLQALATIAMVGMFVLELNRRKG
jgi:hypothetical protein